MGKCYCDYCDVFLTNDSVTVRKQHNEGNRHKYNVCEYYRQLIAQQFQQKIDAIVESFELRLLHGLIIPTYAAPTPPPQQQQQQQQQPIINSSPAISHQHPTSSPPSHSSPQPLASPPLPPLPSTSSAPIAHHTSPANNHPINLPTSPSAPLH